MQQQKKISWLTLYRKYGIFIIIVVLFAGCALVSPNFLKTQNLINILKQISVVAIIACGETLLIVSGMIDLSAGYMCAFAGCLCAGTLVATDSLLLTFIVGIGSAAVCGYVNGVLITVFSLPPFIATLATGNVMQGITHLYTRSQSIPGMEKLRWLGQGTLFGIPYMVLILVAVLIMMYVLMRKTKFGLYVYAIGGNEKASTAAGVNVNRYKRIFCLLSGALVGLSGIIITARMMSGQPNVGPGYEFDAITATIVGGTSFTGGIGTPICVITGSIIIGLISNILNLTNVSSQWQMIVKGVLIATAVIVDLKTKRVKSSM